MSKVFLSAYANANYVQSLQIPRFLFVSSALLLMHCICLFQMQILLGTFEINLLSKMIRAGEGAEYSIV